MRWSRFSLGIIASFTAVTFAADKDAGASIGDGQAAVTSTAAVPDSLQQDHPGVRYYREGDRIATVYGPAFATGASAEQTADGFVQKYAGVLGADVADLIPAAWFREGPNTQTVMPDRDNGGYKFTLVYYSQVRDGVPVFRGEVRLLVRNEPGNPLVLVRSNLRDLGDFHVAGPVENLVSEAAVDAALAVDGSLVAFSRARSVIFAGYDDVTAPATLAVEFVGDNGLIATDEFRQWLFVTDAATGQILYHETMIHHVDVSGVVQGMVTTGFAADACAAEVATGLPYALVSISGGNSNFADVNGNYFVPNAGSSAVTVNSEVRGQWFRVSDQAGPVSSLSQNVTPPGPANFMHNAPNTSALLRAQVNAYVHANIVRDTAISANASYPNLTVSEFPVNVNLASTCNAFYDPAAQTINFYAAGGGCNNTAFGTVVHHEYGHHLVAMAGSGQGQYGEGTGDCMGVLISDASPLGVGFQSCASGIRNANNAMQYPCGDAIHTCGQLISGCVWSTRGALLATDPGTYRTILTDLCVNAILLHSGNLITPQITIDWLTLDDNDGDISNGTPHYNQINQGFTAHNMDAPPLSLLSFSYPNGRPATVSPAGGTRVRVVVGGLAATPQPGTGTLHVSTGGGFTPIAMEQITPNEYDAVFPAATCGTALSYYVSAQTTGSATQTDPPSAPSSSYAAVAAYAETVALFDSFNTNQGWTISNTAVTAGAWVRAAPLVGQNGGRGDPADDFDFNNSALVTGNGNNDDLDGGPTRIQSPLIDMTGGSQAQLTYARWFTNDDNDIDRLVVELSNNNGGAWVTVESVPNSAGWVFRSINVDTILPRTNQMRIRFSATDTPNDSVTEAAVDVVRVAVIDCTPPGFANGDANCDGSIDFFDVDPFLLALFDAPAYAAAFCGGSTATVDINDDASVDFFDVDGFLAILFP